MDAGAAVEEGSGALTKTRRGRDTGIFLLPLRSGACSEVDREMELVV